MLVTGGGRSYVHDMAFIVEFLLEHLSSSSSISCAIVGSLSWYTVPYSGGGRLCDRPPPFGLTMNFWIIFALLCKLRFAIEP